MKKILLILLVFAWCFCIKAQSIVEYQYWYDDDYVNKTVVSHSTTNLNLNSTLNTTGLSAGLHKVNFRAKDNDGKWSTTITEQFYNSGNWNIDTYEYWFDDNYASKITTSVTSGQTYVLTSSLNTSAVVYGFHKLNFRAKDNTGKWSPTISEFFFKSTDGSEMNTAEYWIDSDFANRQSIPFTSSNTVMINQSVLAAVDENLHTFNFRMRDQDGKWSSVTSSYFMGQSQIVSYDYWFDTDFANRVTTTITPTQLLNSQTPLNSSNLSNGIHVVNFRAKNNSGKYSSTIAQNFMVYVTDPPIATNQSVPCNGTVNDLVATGTQIKWYNVATGGSPLLLSTPISAGTYYVTQTLNLRESVRTAVVVGFSSTTWDGLGWSNGTPTALKAVIFTGSYNASSNLTACSVSVSGNANVTVPSTFNWTITNEVNVASSASLTFENNSNLIQTNAVVNIGNITVKRNSASLKLLDYSLWTSPVSGQQLQSFSSATLANRFYVYNPTNNLYKLETATNNFAQGKGYLIRMPDNHPTTPTVWNGSFTGIPQNGNVTISVTNNTYNAIGNPYPSTIDADDFITSNALNEALYFWRKTNGSTYTSYATYTLAGGTANTGGLSSIVPNGTIQVGQGFIAKSTSTSFVFTNSLRTTNNTNQFLKTKAVEKHRIWLNLSKENVPVNQMMVAYLNGASSQIDAAFDGRFINDSPVALNSIINNEEFVIQAKGLPFDDNDAVPLTFKTNVDGNFTISIDHVDGLFLNDQNIYLKDNLLQIIHNIKEKSYLFATTKGIFNNRFELVYKNTNTLGISELESAENKIIVFEKDGVLNVKSSIKNIKKIMVYDILGKLVFQQKNVNQTNTILKNLNKSEQILLVKIMTDDNQIGTQKVIY